MNHFERNEAAINSRDADLLHRLSKLDSHFIQREVARNQATAARTLARLAMHPSYLVRSGVGRHSNADVQTLRWLSKDDDLRVRLAVASNRLCPTSVLTAMARDPLFLFFDLRRGVMAPKLKAALNARLEAAENGEFARKVA